MRDDRVSNLYDRFRPALGLWSQPGGGHTASVSGLDVVHAGPHAVMRLLVAMQGDDWQACPALDILRGIRSTQIVGSGDQFGAFKWYVEEPRLADDHAVFFNGLGFVALWSVYRERLGPECCERLAEMLKDMGVYAMNCALKRKLYYPNEYLGYLICSWFSAEWFGSDADRHTCAELIDEAAEYWLKHHWGWGEHLSNIYGNVLLDELSLLLLFGKLPSRVAGKLKTLFGELLRIDDQFAGGPRVPIIRSYSFDAAPGRSRYRDQIKPMPAVAFIAKSEAMGQRLDTVCTPYAADGDEYWVPLGQCLYDAGWNDLAPPALPPSSSVEIACYDATARAFIDPDMRLGSLSKFPFMPSAEHAAWGLSWQSFPLCLWHSGGSWGFWQWETGSSHGRKCHPAESKASAYLNPALTRSINPPIAGNTFSLQRSGNAIALRTMPAVADDWDSLTDRFRLLGTPTRVQEEHGSDCWTQLIVEYGDRQIGIQCIVPGGGRRPRLTRIGDSRIHWELVWERSELRTMRRAIALWGVSLYGKVRHAPVLQLTEGPMRFPRDSRSEAVWSLYWDWEGGEWRAQVDPAGAVPIRQID